MQETFDKMEKDHNQLEESVRQFESDQIMIKCKEMSIREREQELELMSEKFDKGIQEVMSLEDKLKSSRINATDVQKLDDIRKRYGTAVDGEQIKLKKALEVQFEEKLMEKDRLVAELKQTRDQLVAATERISELQAQVKAEMAAFTTGEKMEEEESATRAAMKARVDELLQVVRPELDSQIGAGIKAAGPDRTIHTHIGKFDTILGGGIPEGHVILVNGAPGTMKSTLTYTILHNAAKYDRDKFHVLLPGAVQGIDPQADGPAQDAGPARGRAHDGGGHDRPAQGNGERPWRLEGHPAPLRQERVRRTPVPGLRAGLARFLQGHLRSRFHPAGPEGPVRLVQVPRHNRDAGSRRSPWTSSSRARRANFTWRTVP